MYAIHCMSIGKVILVRFGLLCPIMESISDSDSNSNRVSEILNNRIKLISSNVHFFPFLVAVCLCFFFFFDFLCFSFRFYFGYVTDLSVYHFKREMRASAVQMDVIISRYTYTHQHQTFQLHKYSNQINSELIFGFWFLDFSAVLFLFHITD